MEFDSLLKLVGDEPVFDSSVLLAGNVDPANIRVQLSRWMQTNKIIQLRRGVYAIAPPYQKKEPHPFLIANRLQNASYISLESALSFYGVIPEVVNRTTCVTSARPEVLETPLGVFEFRHIKQEAFCGYVEKTIDDQQVLVASPEKALLDLLYFHPESIDEKYIYGLRLQNVDQLDPDRFGRFSRCFRSGRLTRTVESLQQIITEINGEYRNL